MATCDHLEALSELEKELDNYLRPDFYGRCPSTSESSSLVVKKIRIYPDDSLASAVHHVMEFYPNGIPLEAEICWKELLRLADTGQREAPGKALELFRWVRQEIQRLSSETAGGGDTAPSETALDPNATKRRGRLPKGESAAKRAEMLATLSQHPTLKDDVAKLANMVGVSESTARRWLEEEEERYRQSRAAHPEPPEE